MNMGLETHRFRAMGPCIWGSVGEILTVQINTNRDFGVFGFLVSKNAKISTLGSNNSKTVRDRAKRTKSGGRRVAANKTRQGALPW